MSKNKVTEERIEHLMETAEYEACVAFDKCVVLMAKFENGFIITESSACVDPENFDMELGVSICRQHIEARLWEMEGYALQKSLYEKAEKAKNRKTKKTQEA